MKQKVSPYDSDEEIFKRLKAKIKADGMLIGGSMFDKDESAKVILHAAKKGKPSNDQSV